MMAVGIHEKRGNGKVRQYMGLFLCDNSSNVKFLESNGLEEHEANSIRGIKGFVDPLP
jgi:hypothetical protein